jgi:hypothetical protein
MGPRRIASLALVVAAFFATSAYAAPKTETQRASIVGRWRARGELKAWKAKVNGKTFVELAPTSGGAMASVVFAKEASSKLDVVIRQPPNTTEAVRLHTAAGRLSAELGGPALEPAVRVVPSAAQAGLLRGTHSVMVTRRAPARFVAASGAPSEWLAKVSEDQRLSGALIDALSHQQDRLPKNLLIDEHGGLRLIDQDSSFGRGDYWGNRSAFYPGGKVAYTSRQESFADLPPALRAQVDDIARSTPDKLQLRYGLSQSESRYLLSTARLIRDRGLSHAIEELQQAGQGFKASIELRSR